MAERPEEPLFDNLVQKHKGWEPQPVRIDEALARNPVRLITPARRAEDVLDARPARLPEPPPAQISPPPAPNKNGPSFKIQLPAPFDRSKKKNTGGLSAARRHVVPDFFPGQLDQLKLGPVRIQPIGFQGASPQINLRTVAFQGFPKGQA